MGEFPISSLGEKETFYIKENNSLVPNGYNIGTGGEGNNGGQNKGKHWSVETKEKISNSLKLKYTNGELISPMKGQIHSKEAIEKIKEKRKLQIITDESIQKAKKTRKETAEKNGFFFSEETKKKIGLANSISLKGNKLSEETKNKVSKKMRERKINVGNKNPMFGKVSSKKGKTYEELYGKEKAEQIKERRRRI